MTAEEWKKKLTLEQYRVLRRKGSEPAFTGKYWNEYGNGIYTCAGCGAQLFDSDTKFNSDTGWPSFDQALPDAVKLAPDESRGMSRTEVTCAKCGGHLGHVFSDGPKETTGQRYCINSCVLDLKKEKRVGG